MYAACLDIPEASAQFRTKCIDNYADYKAPEFWPVAWEAFQGALLVGAVIWLLCFAATRTIRWILAGREN